jgi:hypothetical protein
MSGNLIHFSDAPLGDVRSTPQWEQPHMKPRGLWLSVEDGDHGWSNWCQGENWGLERLTHAHDVTLRDDASILRLAGGNEIDAFTAQFQVVPDDPKSSRSDFRGHYINWRAVAQQYQGIIIAPYCWSRRLHDGTVWYYGWDCASGCIWDADAIERVTLIERAPAMTTPNRTDAK